MLGGSSAMNAMVYLRGNRRDYDDWHSFGNPTWSYDEVLPYFLKSEHNTNAEFVQYKNGKYHSVKGPLKVGLYRQRSETHPVEEYFLAAGKELGYEHVDNFNADKVLGFGRIQGTVYNGRRQSTAKAFLIPAKDRPNLHIIKHAHATKIQINDNGKATGVEFVYEGKKKLLAKAKKEIVVSAGAIQSPNLLLLSGVGPENELKKHKIPMKKNLAVGKNLQDHLLVPVFFKFDRLKNVANEFDINRSMFDYLVHNKGMFSNIGITDLVGFINTVNKTGYPDIEIQHSVIDNELNFLEGLGHSDDVQKVLIDITKKCIIGVAFVILLKPTSMGSISLNSADPLDKPNVDANYLAEGDDWQTMMNGVKFEHNQIHTKAFKKYGGSFIRLPLPECDKLTFESDEYFKCYINQLAETVYHPTGTCKMGPKSDKDAVVDSRLSVHGIQNLRVIDASIMPKIVSANTNAASIMIGEKGADFIKEDWNAQHDEL